MVKGKAKEGRGTCVNGGQEFPIFGGLKIHHLTILVKTPKVVKYDRN